ncbi:MAG: phosphoadenylyl-sulfate reductase [Bacteroidota bacterium]
MKSVLKESSIHPQNASEKPSSFDLDHLNAIFTPLSFQERLHLLYAYFHQSEVLVTSSFGTQSVFLLHLLHQLKPTQKVHFINTGYHFPETLAYRKLLESSLQLSIIDVHPAPEQHQLSQEQSMWENQPNRCCFYNKVKPLQGVKVGHKVWISGVMGFQTPTRKGLRVFEQSEDIIKFHPFIDIDEGELLYHMDRYKLPRHPLEAKGYGSIGCSHCTRKGDGRSGRWSNSNKTECGLHLPMPDSKA